MAKEKIYNIPNALSAYRLIIFPFVLLLLFQKNESLFSIFIAINLLTDFLDGFIARTFNMVTKFGARLDSLADYGTYLLAFSGLFTFKRPDLQIHGWLLYIFMLLLVLSQIIHIYKFGTFSSLHLYSFKTTGYLHGLLFILWFFIGFFPGYYYFAMGFGILAELELISITLILKQKRSNARGIYWVLNE
ncbi:CDP-alcohol phosphatidyltransferase family protein [Draconibacterium sp.]|uniref:CDP-alcohol phosphatidyltransferase family protein n=1 Tax=Draconibacterium sp. TaxID=1965318 RepID=UPI003566ABB9